MSISVEAAAAHDSLSDDKELIHTFEVLELLFNYIFVYGLLICRFSFVLIILWNLSLLYFTLEINSTRWQKTFCFSSCSISQGRSWKAQVKSVPFEMSCQLILQNLFIYLLGLILSAFISHVSSHCLM